MDVKFDDARLTMDGPDSNYAEQGSIHETIVKVNYLVYTYNYYFWQTGNERILSRHDKPPPGLLVWLHICLLITS